MRIVLCVPGASYSREWVIHWTKLITVLKDMGHEIIVSLQYSSFVSFARAQCLGANVLAGEDQVPFNGMPYDKIIFIDSDVLVTPEQIEQLLSSPHPVTCGMYIMSDNIQYAIVKDWDIEYYAKHGTFQFIKPEDVELWRKENNDNNYMKVSYAGLGITSISYGVFENEKMKYPWFFRDIETIKGIDGKIIRDGSSEDVSLCRNLIQSGYDIYIDTRIKCPHLKLIPLCR